MVDRIVVGDVVAIAAWFDQRGIERATSIEGGTVGGGIVQRGYVVVGDRRQKMEVGAARFRPIDSTAVDPIASSLGNASQAYRACPPRVVDSNLSRGGTLKTAVSSKNTTR